MPNWTVHVTKICMRLNFFTLCIGSSEASELMYLDSIRPFSWWSSAKTNSQPRFFCWIFSSTCYMKSKMASIPLALSPLSYIMGWESLPLGVFGPLSTQLKKGLLEVRRILWASIFHFSSCTTDILCHTVSHCFTVSHYYNVSYCVRLLYCVKLYYTVRLCHYMSHYYTVSHCVTWCHTITLC